MDACLPVLNIRCPSFGAMRFWASRLAGHLLFGHLLQRLSNPQSPRWVPSGQLFGNGLKGSERERETQGKPGLLLAFLFWSAPLGLATGKAKLRCWPKKEREKNIMAASLKKPEDPLVAKGIFQSHLKKVHPQESGTWLADTRQLYHGGLANRLRLGFSSNRGTAGKGPFETARAPT